ncbi:UNVERIFIED_CONTAM: hypothetical protein NCL1_30575 [Trichonephila clavipes]
MSPEQLKAIYIYIYIALETIHNQFPTSEWVHIFTDGSLLDRYHGDGAGIFCKLLSFYLPFGIFATVFDGEIEGITLAVDQLSLRSSEFNNAVIFSDSKYSLQVLSLNYLCNSQRILKCRSFLRELGTL